MIIKLVLPWPVDQSCELTQLKRTVLAVQPLAIVRECTIGPSNLSRKAVLRPVTKVESHEKNAINAILHSIASQT